MFITLFYTTFSIYLIRVHIRNIIIVIIIINVINVTVSGYLQKWINTRVIC
jgi:hypothetical protein